MPGVQPAELWQESGRWEQYRAGAAAHQGSPRTRLLPRPHARRSHHRHRAQRTQELPAAAGELLPDPDQVPRRDPAAFRRDARARIPHEGRLLVPPRRRRPAGELRRACTTAYTAHLHAAGPEVPLGGRRHRRDRRQRARRNSTCSPTPAKTRSRSRTATRLRRQSGDGRGTPAADAARRADGEPCRRSPRPAHGPSTTSPRSSSYPPRSTGEDAAGRRRPKAASWRCWCAAITN